MPEEDKQAAEKEQKEKETPKEVISQTKHAVTVNGKTLEYTVTAGTIVLKEENEEDAFAQFSNF